MILALIDILAKGSGGGSSSGNDADSSIKFIFGGIVVVIWIVGGIMSQMKKKADRERWNNPQPQQDWSHLLRDLTAGQNKPFTPGTPAPPHLQPPPPQRQQQNPPRIQQTKSFAQQSPRPFVQQYPQRQQIQQYPQRPPPVRRHVAPPLKAKPFQGPRPILRKPKPQRRPPAIPPHSMQVRRPPEAQVGLIQDSPVIMGQAGGATLIQNATARSSAPRVTRSQLRKLILWSEILAPPLALRETSPK